MSALTAGNWIAYQNPAQEKHGHWSVGIENQYGIHGVGSGELRDVSFDVGGICTEADARAMAECDGAEWLFAASVRELAA